MPDYTDIQIVLKDMPTTVHALIVLGEDYTPVAIINSRLPQEMQEAAFLHELKHYLLGDMDNESYDEYGDVI